MRQHLLIVVLLSTIATQLLAWQAAPAPAEQPQAVAIPQYVSDREGPWKATMFAIARIEAADDFVNFQSTMTYWERGYLGSVNWSVRTEGDLTEQHAFSGSPASIYVGGNCLVDVRSDQSALILIHGDLAAKIVVGANSEVIVLGNLLKGASIQGNSISAVYVGGNVSRDANVKGVGHLWVGGSIHGTIHAPEPWLHIHVGADFLGHVNPMGVRGGLLTVNVVGFMPDSIFQEMVAKNFTRLTAFAGLSDIASGLHSSRQVGCRWVVEDTVSAKYLANIGWPPPR